jgi:hypothetical protein
MVQLHWARARGGAWCDLQRVDLETVDATGVFVIWHGGRRPRTLRLGYGRIAERVGALKRDPALLRYRTAGPLYVTWAAVPPHLMDGVGRYLAGRMMPVFEDRVRPAAAIPANLPGN